MDDALKLLIEIEPGKTSWTVCGPRPWLERRTVASPFADRQFLTRLAEVREWSGRPVRRSDPQAPGIEEYIRRLARQVGGLLEGLLLPRNSRDEILQRVGSGKGHLTLRVHERSDQADRVLALPWELVAFGEAGLSFRVVREAVAEGAPELPPPSRALAVGALIAAPEDLSPLAYEEEALRLQIALASLGHQVSFADLGRLQDLADLAEARDPQVLHFSGHSREGQLLFEDQLGLADELSVEELERRLRVVLLNPARRGRFPSLFFLSVRGRIAAGPGSEISDLESGPIAAARLHRAGFAQVLGFFGPLDGELASRAEEAFYAALGRGEVALSAVSAARATLTEPLGDRGGDRWYPLGEVLLAVYLRGPDRPLADGSAVQQPVDSARRRMVELSGLPALEQGFVGRRGLQHEILQRIHAGQRLLVLQGLGGLGKTTLASHLLIHALAPDAADRLILRCQGLSEAPDPVLNLWSQIEEHGVVHQLPGWSARVRYLRETSSGAVVGLAAAVREIRRDRQNLVVYIDDVESLQIGPRGDSAPALGSWRSGLDRWWAEIERLADEGTLILASTRYAWAGLETRAHLAVGPLSDAETWRLIDSFASLARLPRRDRRRLMQGLEGHPRAVEFLDFLVGLKSQEVGTAGRDDEVWAELIEPILPDGERSLREDLLLEELWQRLPGNARDHARRLAVLRQSAPAWMVDRLGSARDVLIRASLLTRYRSAISDGRRIRWIDLWGLHGVVRERIVRDLDEESRAAFHRAAGEAWADWLQESGWLREDQREAIFHLHTIRDAGRAWPIVQDHAHWLRVQGRFSEAQGVLEESVAAGLKGESRPLALVLLANVRTVRGDPGVETLYQQLLASKMPDDLRAQALHEYAVFLDLATRYEEAEAQVRRALELKKSSLDAADYEIGVTQVLLGRVLESRGLYTEAEKELREALSILERAPDELRPQVSVTWHSLARVLDKLGRLGEAEVLFRKAAEFDLPAAGEDDPQYAVSLQSLGWILAQRGKLQEAESWLRKALDVQERTFGHEHPETTTTLLTLGRVLLLEERVSEAEDLFREVVAIEHRTLPQDHGDRGWALIALGGLLFKKGRLAEAEGLLREALAIQERALGAEHFSLVSALTNLGGVLVAQDRVSEAETLLERALRLAQAAQGPEGPESARVLPWLARAQLRLGRPQAAATARRALGLLSRTLGPDHPVTRQSEPILRQIAGDG